MESFITMMFLIKISELKHDSIAAREKKRERNGETEQIKNNSEGTESKCFTIKN